MNESTRSENHVIAGRRWWLVKAQKLESVYHPRKTDMTGSFIPVDSRHTLVVKPVIKY